MKLGKLTKKGSFGRVSKINNFWISPVWGNNNGFIIKINLIKFWKKY